MKKKKKINNKAKGDTKEEKMEYELIGPGASHLSFREYTLPPAPPLPAQSLSQPFPVHWNVIEEKEEE
jgi:hypothetical protein